MLGANSIISTQRLVETDGKEAFSEDVLTDVECYIEQTNAEKAVFWGDHNVFFIYTMYIDGLPDIRVGDRVTDEDDNVYTVKGVQKFKGGDVPSHCEVVINKVDNA